MSTPGIETQRAPDASMSSPLGATVTRRGVRFAVYTTTASRVSVRTYGRDNRVLAEHPLRHLGRGRHEIEVGGLGPGVLYKFVLDGTEVPDPYARFLPFGVEGPARVEQASMVVPRRFEPAPLADWVIYEIHIGTFSASGTYQGAIEKLDDLAALGINAIELMPVAAFAGSRGWGYDGVALYAPFAPYGEPADLRALVRAAHDRGIVVLLDVVYNHFGPAGNHLARYAPEYFSDHIENAWGPAPNYAEPHMRRLVLHNVRYWLEQFDFDGLRLDATHGIVDQSERHILADIAALAHALPRPRAVFAEDERNDPKLVEEYCLDGVWADDFHHVLRVTMTKEQDGYYAAYKGGAEELARTIQRGWLYEGQVYEPSGKKRGQPATLAPTQLVYTIQNHDQIGNRAEGTRLTADVDAEAYAAASILLLFLPAVPLLFMGQEWASSAPFLFFTDHDAELGAAITNGRRKEFASFSAFQDPQRRDAIPDPQAASTFERSKLDWAERERPGHREIRDLYARLLKLRRNDPVLSARTDLEVSVESTGLLKVVRKNAHGERAVLFNPSAEPIAIGPLATGARVLESTSTVHDILAAHGAILLVLEPLDAAPPQP